MKRLLVASLLILSSAALYAEDPNQWAGMFVNGSQYGKVTGGVVYARKLSTLDGEHTLYSYSAVNINSVQKEPFKIMTTPETGAAIKVTRFWKFDVFALGTVGTSLTSTTDGTSAGFTYGGGGFAITKIKKNINIGPTFRTFKTNVSGVEDSQWSVGVLLGFGSN